MPRSPHIPPPQPAPPPTGKPDRRALLQAYQEVVRTTKRKKPVPARAPVPVRASLWTAIGLTIAGLAAVVVFQPRWLFPRPAPEPPQLQEASLRIRMFVEIEHINRFQSAKGRLPTSLIEAGGDSVGLTYTRRGGRYTLSGKNGAIRVIYRSGTQPESFLGNSYQLVRERAR